MAVTIAILGALASIASISAFIFARMKDAEQRGAEKEKISNLEKRLTEYEVARKQDKLDAENDRKQDLQKIEVKFDKVIDKLEKIQSDLKINIDSHVTDYHRGA